MLYAATITATATVTNPFPAPPAGKKAVAVSGTFTLNAGDKVDKIEASFYTKNAMGNLKFEGSVNDPNWTKAAYNTSEFVATAGTTYIVITDIYVNSNKASAGQGITTITP